MRVPPARGGPGLRLETGLAGHRAWALSGRRGPETPVPGRRGGPRRLASSPSKTQSPLYPSPGQEKRGVWPEERGRGFGAPGWSGWSGFWRRRSRRGSGRVLCAFVPVRTWGAKGVRISCTYSRVFPLLSLSGTLEVFYTYLPLNFI